MNTSTSLRAIRVINERSRCIMADLPWKLPVILTKWLRYYVCMRINALPRMGSGCSLKRQRVVSGYKTCLQAFAITLRRIVHPPNQTILNPDRLAHCWIFMDLNTGKTLTSIKWGVSPISNIIVSHINSFGDYAASQQII